MTTTHRITTTAAVILSLAAAGAPTAIARPVGADTATAANQAPATIYSRPDKTTIPTSWPYPYGGNPKAATAEPATVPQAVVRIQTPQSGFDWGDAGIGAAGGVALAMLGLGGALVITHRPKRARHNTGLAS
jgi:hypothetical protein